MHAELKGYSSLVDKLIVRQESKVKSFPPNDQRIGGEEKKLQDLKKIQVVISCSRNDPGIDVKLETHNPDRANKLRKQIDAFKNIAPAIQGGEDLAKRRMRAFEMSDQVKGAVEERLAAAQASLESLGVLFQLIEPSPSLLATDPRSYFIAECSIRDCPDLKLMVRMDAKGDGAEALFYSAEAAFFSEPRTSILRSLLQNQPARDLISLVSTWKALVS